MIDGEIERVFADLFRRILVGDPALPRVVKIPKEMQPPVEEIPVVRHRSTFGVCEIAPVVKDPAIIERLSPLVVPFAPASQGFNRSGPARGGSDHPVWKREARGFSTRT